MHALAVVFIFHYRPVVEATGQAYRGGVHFADIDGVVTAVAQPLDPVGLAGREPGFVVFDAVGVDVLARDDAVARRAAAPWVKACEKAMPRCASRSRLGVTMCSKPRKRRVSQRCWSVIIKTILGWSIFSSSSGGPRCYA